MSDAQSDSVGNGDGGLNAGAAVAATMLNILHHTICTDDRPDVRYIRRLSNQEKVAKICEQIGIEPDEFDIGDTDAAPFDNWLRTLDGDRATIGMYVADLRVQFYTRVAEKIVGKDDLKLQQMIADAEWWWDKFSDVLHTYNTGSAPPKKLLH